MKKCHHTADAANGTILKTTDYNPTQRIHVQTLGGLRQLDDKDFAPTTCYFFANDFPGMDCEAYVLTKLRQAQNNTQLWSCEAVGFASEFPNINYNTICPHNDVNCKPFTKQHDIDLYATGPPCQGRSAAGLKHTWKDPRLRIYMQVIFAIEKARPETFLPEHAATLQHVDNCKIARAITDKLRTMGCNVLTSIINTRNYGLPQNRARFWIVGIRGDVYRRPFAWPKHIDRIALSDLLVAKELALATEETGPLVGWLPGGLNWQPKKPKKQCTATTG